MIWLGLLYSSLSLGEDHGSVVLGPGEDDRRVADQNPAEPNPD